MVRDGVTSALELEVGTGDVATWYDDREAGQIVNYGVSVGHIKARMKVLGDPSTALLPAGVGGTGTATDAQIAEMEAILRKGLADGAVAVGFGSAYTPGATMAEIERMFRVAAEGNASAHIHMRNGVAGSRLDDRRRGGGEREAAHRARELERRHEPRGVPRAHQGGARSRAGRDDRGVSVRRRDDGDPVGAVRRLEDVARREVRAAPARVDRRAAHAEDVRGRRARKAAR